jgi:hypothetical protein
MVFKCGKRHDISVTTSIIIFMAHLIASEEKHGFHQFPGELKLILSCLRNTLLQLKAILNI